MKKIIVGLLFVAATLVSKSVFAGGPNTYNMYIATTNAIVSGTGSLFGIAISSGSAGDYVVCYDTYSQTGNFATAQGTTAFPELLRIFVSSSSSNQFAKGYAEASVPLLNFSVGLTCAQSAADRAFIWYRQPN